MKIKLKVLFSYATKKKIVALFKQPTKIVDTKIKFCVNL